MWYSLPTISVQNQAETKCPRLMLEYIYCYIYIQLYKQPRQEREYCNNFSRCHRCVPGNRAAYHWFCSQFEAQNKSHTFFLSGKFLEILSTYPSLQASHAENKWVLRSLGLQASVAGMVPWRQDAEDAGWGLPGAVPSSHVLARLSKVCP